MSSGKELSVPAVGTTVLALGPTADHFFDRSRVLAIACSYAMAEGKIHVANELYERGVNAMHSAIWHERLAKCVGSDFTLMSETPQ